MVVRLEEMAGSSKECRGGLGNGPGRCPGREAHRLVRIGIEDKEGVSDLGGLGIILLAMPAPLPFAGAAPARWIDGQEGAAAMP